MTALPIRVRLADDRVWTGEIPAERHRRIHLGMLHADTGGYVEIAAGPRPPGGKLRITTRRDPGHFLPGGASGEGRWLDALAGLAARHASRGEEVCVAPAVRSERAAAKAHVAHTNWLWVDIDGTEGLPAVRRFLSTKPAHLVTESAGSGGLHCYWRMDVPLRADGDAIERAHERLIFALGYTWKQGRPIPTVADRACKDRSRVMRLAGTVNGKTGRHARVIWADFALAPWTLQGLVGDLADPPEPRRNRRRPATPVGHEDPYKRIPPVDYFQRLAQIEVPARGLVSCPNPAHTDATPSCCVSADPGDGWCCHGCGAAGAIYDLASVLQGGPTGRWLRGDEFRRARERVRQAYGAA